jgi:hypothetical protein
MKRIVAPLVSALMVMAITGCTRVAPDEIGVRTLNFGSDKGIVAQDYEPGFHRYVWPLDSWHRFPSTVQHLRFAKSLSRGPGEGLDTIQVTSADGDRVVVTAGVCFRIADNAAHQVLADSGAGERYRAVVANLAPDAARTVFGQLRTEDFYNPERREAARHAGADLLRERLRPRGLELVDLLVESIEFDHNYENLIRDKKIADQRAELEKAKARAAAEKGKVATLQAETTAKVQKVERETESKKLTITTETAVHAAAIKAEAEKFSAQHHAEADLYADQQRAAGQQLLLAAEAEGTRRMNAALTGDGSQNLVALEALSRLNLAEVVFPSGGFDWFNPREMARRIGAAEPTPPAAPPPAEAPEGKR